MNKPIHALLAVLAAAGLSIAGPVAAQDYPTKPVHWVIPDTPGGVNDRTARLMSPAFGKALGQPVIVDNKPGAAGVVAWEFVAKNSPADGHTIAMIHSGIMTVPLFFKELRFDVQKDLRHVMIFAEGGIPFIASADAPFNNFKEFLSYAKANPGKLNFGSPGFQSLPTLMIEGVKRKFGIDVFVVVYKAAGDVAPAIYGNQVQLSMFSESSTVIGVKAGKIKVIASVAGTRSLSFPDVPTLAELGMSEVSSGSIFGIAVARAVPEPIFERIYRASRAMMDSAELKDQLTKVQVYPAVTTPQEAERKIAVQSQFYAGLAKSIGIQPQ